MNTSPLTLTLQNGTETVSVPSSLERTTVFYFMRAAGCPQCNRHARDLDRLMPQVRQHGFDAIVVVPETVELAAKVKERNKLALPVMAGNGDAHTLAGLDKKVLGLIQQSATIVIDRSGAVLYKHVATNPENSFNEKEFLDYLSHIPTA